MNNILLRREVANNATVVPNEFIDKYMPQANGEYVKIFIYLLRSYSDRDTNFSIGKMADLMEHTEKDISRALIYWERMGLLELSYDTTKNLSGITILDSAFMRDNDPRTPDPDHRIRVNNNQDIIEEKAANIESRNNDSYVNSNTDSVITDNPPALPEKREYTKDELSYFRENEDVKEMFFCAESYLKRPLTKTETDTLLYWYDGLEFSADLVDYLLEYCVSRGHMSIHYMNKVALAWAEIDISTVAQAKKQANIHSTANYAVMKAFGIKNRSLVDLETEMVNKWTKEYGFSLDIIAKACEKTILNIGSPSFQYADTILTDWHNKQIKELKDIEALDEAFQSKKNVKGNKNTAASNERSEKKASNNQFHNFTQRSYDYEELERQMLNRKRN